MYSISPLWDISMINVGYCIANCFNNSILYFVNLQIFYVFRKKMPICLLSKNCGHFLGAMYDTFRVFSYTRDPLKQN